MTSNRSSNKIPHCPSAERIVKIKEDTALIEVISRFRSKTNGYVVDRMSTKSILDKSGEELTAKWDKDWAEIAPGIETRSEREVERTSIGTYKHKSAKTGSIRLHRHACLIHVQFISTHEYVDYNDSSYSSSDSYYYWSL